MVGLAHGQAAEPQRESGQLMSWPYYLSNPDTYFDVQSAHGLALLLGHYNLYFDTALLGRNQSFRLKGVFGRFPRALPNGNTRLYKK